MDSRSRFRKWAVERLETRQMLAGHVLGNATAPIGDNLAPLETTHVAANPHSEFRIARSDFEQSISNGIGGWGGDGSPFNQEIHYTNAVYRAMIEAGSATGSPPDTPSARVDPNDGTARFAGVGSLEGVFPSGARFICTGSVITSRHVLTAGHCFDHDHNGQLDANLADASVFHLNDGGSPSATLEIESVDLHPDFGGFESDGANDDLAIVTLASPVPAGTTIYPLMTTGMALGQIIDIVGYGVSGHGDVGGTEVQADFHVKRSGMNQVGLFVKDDEGVGPNEVFLYDFDGPTGTGYFGGGTLGNDVETVVRPGDSGGPAFVTVGDSLAIAGVNTFEFWLTNITPPPGEFGVMGGGVMLGPPLIRWISSITEQTGESIIAIDVRGDDIVGFSQDAGFWVGESHGVSLETNHYGDWSSAKTYNHLSSADVNGDGLDDMVALAEDGELAVALSTGDSSFVTDSWGGLTTNTEWSEVHVGDFNGDGLDDVLGRADVDGTFWLAESTGKSFVNSYWGKFTTAFTWSDMTVGDFNGDGRDDIMARASDGTWWGAISQGDSFNNSYWGKWSTEVDWSDVSVGDFDGDGLDDVSGRASNGDWWINRSLGNSFAIEYWTSWNDSIAWKDVLVGDFDGDGRDDIAGRASGTWWVAMSNGSRFLNTYWATWSTLTSWSDVALIDVDGDGRDDILGRSSNGEWWVGQSTGSGFNNVLIAKWPPDVWLNVAVGNFRVA